METRSNRTPLLLGLLLLVVAALATWAFMKQRRSDVPAQPAAETVTQDPASLAQTQAQPSLANMRGMPMPTASQGGGLRGKLPMTEADRQKALAARDRQMAAFEQSHRAEPVDAAWASKAKADLDAIVTSEAIVASGIKPADYSADCRSATCRISAEFKSSGDAEDWGTFYLASSGKTIRQAKMTIVQNPAGGSEVRIYGTRR
jgi:hypothetical protein